MIYGTLDQSARYTGMLPGIDRILNEAERFTPHDEFGRTVQLDGENIYMILAEYDTHEKAKGYMEAHRAYIDVMCMISGEETIYMKPAQRLRHVTQPYNAQKDALLAEIDDDCSAIRLQAGDFIILFPEDAHAPGCRTEMPSHVKKIIGKVRL